MSSLSVPQPSVFKSLLETSCSYNRHPAEPGTLATLPSTATDLILLYLSPSMMLNGDILSFAMTMPVNFRIWLTTSRYFADTHLRQYPEYTADFNLQQPKSDAEYQKWFHLPHSYKMSLFPILQLKCTPTIPAANLLGHAVIFGKSYIAQHLLIENPELRKSQVPNFIVTGCVKPGYTKTMAIVLSWDMCSKDAAQQALLFAVSLNKPVMIRQFLAKFPEMVNDSHLMEACFSDARMSNSSEVYEVLLEFLLQTGSAQPDHDKLNDALQKLCAPRKRYLGFLPESKGLAGAVKRVLSFQNCDPASNNCMALMNAASQRYTRIVALFLRDKRVSDLHKKSMCLLYALRYKVKIIEFTDLDERLEADFIYEMVKSMSKEEMMDHLPALVTGSPVHASEGVSSVGQFFEHEKVAAHYALSSALRLKCMNLLNALIETPGSNIRDPDGRGVDALGICIEEGYIEGLSRILPLLRSAPIRICVQAIKSQKLDFFEILLNDYTRRPRAYPKVHQAQLLLAAADSCNYPAVKLLLVQYNSDQHGNEPLVHALLTAIERRNVDMVQLLLSNITEISDSDCKQMCKAASHDPSLLEVLRQDGRFDVSDYVSTLFGDLHEG
ncbi:hypothetical protein HDU77_006841 [Chytriomyces hyalinus]|nr:hypothetical protein HDU77_006841 [Chytriomyces hyalinus]